MQFVPALAANVRRIDPGGLTKLPVSKPTNVYLKIQMFFSEPQIKCHEVAEILRANDDQVSPLGFICCYVPFIFQVFFGIVVLMRNSKVRPDIDLLDANNQ